MIILEKIAKLVDLKSIITLAMTTGMILLLTGVFNPPDAVFALFSTSYGSIMTHFFVKKTTETKGE